jgi:hypothetical protein
MSTILLAAWLGAAPLAAQEPAGPETRPPIAGSLIEAFAGSPGKLSMGAGLFRGRRSNNPYGTIAFVATLEPGLGGGKLSAGYGQVNLFGNVLAKASLLRTWGHPWHAQPNRTFVGLEGQTPILPIARSAARIGLFRDIKHDDWLVSWSLGVSTNF